MRATRAYMAGFGTAGSLLAGAAILFVLASAVVAVRGWPQIDYHASAASLTLAGPRAESKATLLPPEQSTRRAVTRPAGSRATAVASAAPIPAANGTHAQPASTPAGGATNSPSSTPAQQTAAPSSHPTATPAPTSTPTSAPACTSCSTSTTGSSPSNPVNQLTNVVQSATNTLQNTVSNTGQNVTSTVNQVVGGLP